MCKSAILDKPVNDISDKSDLFLCVQTGVEKLYRCEVQKFCLYAEAVPYQVLEGYF